MSRFFLALMMVLLIGSCSERRGSAPRDLDNACTILTERSHYVGGLRAAKRNWGVEPHVLMAIIYQESKFISNNRTPHQYALGVIPMGRQSSAFGYPQALDGTWDEYRRAEGGLGARRDDFADATDFMGWYMAQTTEETGVPLNATREQYLAYHEGRTGYLRGSYRGKSWLLRIADEVAQRSVMYERQIASCRRVRL